MNEINTFLSEMDAMDVQIHAAVEGPNPITENGPAILERDQQQELATIQNPDVDNPFDFIRLSTYQIWTGNFFIIDAPEAQLPEEYQNLAQQQFGGGGSLVWLTKSSPYFRKSGIRVTTKRCSFYHVSNCPFIIRELMDMQTRLACIEIGSLPHSNHNLTLTRDRRPGVSRYIQSIVISSPSKMENAPGKIVHSARKKGFQVDRSLAKSIRRKVYRIRNPRLHCGPAPASTWGGIASAFEMYKREVITNFNTHSVYLVALDINAESNSLVAILSTENMILNAYRQRFWGNPIFFAADASYRLTQEKNGVYPVITTNLAMETKTIAYGIISHEHHKAQRFILQSIKSEVERLIKVKTHNGETSV